MAAKKKTEEKTEIFNIEEKKSDGQIIKSEVKVTLSDSSSTYAEYVVEVSELSIAQIVKHKVQEASKNSSLKGFRPGKAPLDIIKKKYNSSIMQDVLQYFVDKSSGKVIAEKNLQMALEPKVEIKDFSEKNLQFVLKLEIYPEIQIPDFSKISIEKPTFEIKDSDLDETLSKIAESNSEYEKTDKNYAAKIKDTVDINYEGKIDGKKFDGGSAKNYKLHLGSKSFIDNFEEQLVGLKAGSKKTVKVNFPQEYHAKDLAGRPAEFDVTINEVLKAKTPKIDDELAKKLSFANLNELKDRIKKQLEMDYNTVVETKMRKELFDVLEKECTFDVPETMVKNEFESLWKNAQENHKNENPSKKEEEKQREDLQQMANRRVKLGVLLAELGKINKIQIEQKEMQEALLRQTRMYPGQEQKVYEFYQKNPRALESLKGPILEDKVVKLIFDKVKLKEKKYKLEDLLKKAEV